MSNLSDVLDVTVNNVERPPVVPFGTYIAAVDKPPSEREFTSNKDGRQWIAVDFPMRLLSPREDVDQEMLATFGNLANAKPLSNTFMADNSPEGKKQLQWNLRQFFLNTLALDPGPDSNPKSLKQLAAEAVGQQCLVTVLHTLTQDKATGESVPMANIRGTAKL